MCFIYSYVIHSWLFTPVQLQAYVIESDDRCVVVVWKLQSVETCLKTKMLTLEKPRKKIGNVTEIRIGFLRKTNHFLYFFNAAMKKTT